MSTPEHTFCCSLCGSTNVECLHWVNPTTCAIESDNDDEARCNACHGIEKASELSTLASYHATFEMEPYEVIRLVRRYHNTLESEDQLRVIQAWSGEQGVELETADDDDTNGWVDFEQVEGAMDDDIHNDVGPGHLLSFLAHWFEWAVDEAERNDPNPD